METDTGGVIWARLGTNVLCTVYHRDFSHFIPVVSLTASGFPRDVSQA